MSRVRSQVVAMLEHLHQLREEIHSLTNNLKDVRSRIVFRRIELTTRPRRKYLNIYQVPNHLNLWWPRRRGGFKTSRLGLVNLGSGYVL